MLEHCKYADVRVNATAEQSVGLVIRNRGGGCPCAFTSPSTGTRPTTEDGIASRAENLNGRLRPLAELVKSFNTLENFRRPGLRMHKQARHPAWATRPLSTFEYRYKSLSAVPRHSGRLGSQPLTRGRSVIHFAQSRLVVNLR
ncbi:hypothetical protein EVAR_5881_1 [Eumeta japonica]|uniref:Uncharacterized protein n=1 Tax=Eumeta variegata TaxID=151549 RepID=A0A4C1TD28_EUMVA|nr:hypothetical protein EVAR_5881_1 [Eumeta japonica]